MGAAPSLVIPEGGGEDLVIPQVRVMLPDDREVFIAEAALVRRVVDADEPGGDSGD